MQIFSLDPLAPNVADKFWLYAQMFSFYCFSLLVFISPYISNLLAWLADMTEAGAAGKRDLSHLQRIQ